MANGFTDLHVKIAGELLTAASVAALPASEKEGAIRYVVDIDAVYTYDGAAWNAISGGGGGAGDVNGPVSATDNAVVRFNGTGGKTIQNSGVTIDDANNLGGVGAISTDGPITDASLTASRAVVSDGSKNYVSSATTATEIGYVAGVTSGIQTQLGTKVVGPASSTDNAVARFDSTTGKLVQDSVVTIADTSGNTAGVGSLGVAGPITDASLTASRVVVSDGSKSYTSSATTATEIGYVSGVTSAIQTQIDTKASASGLATHIADVANPHVVTKTQVGLGNVDNTSDATKNAASVTLTNKTLTSPVINSPTGIIKSDVGLGNVDNTSDSTKNAAFATLTNKTLTSPVINSPTGIVKADVGLSNVDNTSNATERAATATLTNKTLTSPVINSPTGIVKADVGLGNVDNTSNATERAAVATLANKTLTTPVISQHAEFSESLTPVTPSAGFVRLYATTEKKFYLKDSGGLIQPVAGTGIGELNLVASPSDVAGWTRTGTAGAAGNVPANTSNLGDVPLYSIVNTAIQLVSATTAGAETAAYVSYAFTTPASLATKLKVEFYMRPGTNFISNEWTVSVFAGSTRQPLSTDDTTPYTYLPNAAGKFTTTFDCAASTAYTLRFARRVNTGANAATLNIANVIVGPGIQPQGAVVGPWISYTPTGAWTSNTTYAGMYRRNGTNMDITAKISTSGAPTSASCTLNLPSGFTIDTSQMAGADAAFTNVGVAEINDSSTTGYTGIVAYASTTSVRVLYPNTSGGALANVSQAGPITFGAGDSVNIVCSVPIAEWAGSGTVNLAQNDVEYVSHDGTNITYGPNGAVLLTTTPSGISEEFTVTTGFATVQTTDSFLIEIQPGGSGAWMPLPDETIENLQYDGTNYVGLGIRQTGGAIQLVRGKYRSRAGSTASTWAGIAASSRVRIKKFAGGQAVAFGKATPTSNGLITSYAPTVQSSILNTSTAYTVTDTDGYAHIFVTCGGTDRAITLPTASTNTGREITITKVDTDATSAGGHVTIAAVVSVKLAIAYDSITVRSNGTSWYFVGELFHSEVASSTWTFNGTGGNTGAVDVVSVRRGSLVTVHLPTTLRATTGTSSTTFTSTAFLPTNMRPGAQFGAAACNLQLRNNAAADTTGVPYFDTTGGIITLQRNAAATTWTNAANGGLQLRGMLSWYV